MLQPVELLSKSAPRLTCDADDGVYCNHMHRVLHIAPHAQHVETIMPPSVVFADYKYILISRMVAFSSAAFLHARRQLAWQYCAGDVDHFQTEKGDSGWGCGWRNIQMVCSHLLRHDKV